MIIENRRGGLYRIIGPNGKVYIGRAKNFRERTKIHLNSLARNAHTCASMQEDYNAYGASAFSSEILEEIESDAYRIEAEQEYLDRLFREYPSDKIYNISLNARFYSSKGKKRKSRPTTSEYTRRMISRGHKQRKLG